eukprot:1524985-Pleurochrysis_carterae.AAC.1
MRTQRWGEVGGKRSVCSRARALLIACPLTCRARQGSPCARQKAAFDDMDRVLQKMELGGKTAS